MRPNKFVHFLDFFLLSDLCEAQEEFPAGLETVDGLHSFVNLVVKALQSKKAMKMANVPSYLT